MQYVVKAAHFGFSEKVGKLSPRSPPNLDPPNWLNFERSLVLGYFGLNSKKFKVPMPLVRCVFGNIYYENGHFDKTMFLSIILRWYSDTKYNGKGFDKCKEINVWTQTKSHQNIIWWKSQEKSFNSDCSHSEVASLACNSPKMAELIKNLPVVRDFNSKF